MYFVTSLECSGLVRSVGPICTNTDGHRDTFLCATHRALSKARGEVDCSLSYLCRYIIILIDSTFEQSDNITIAHIA